MAIVDDISVASNGDIRYTGTTTTYTVLELHRFLQALADDESASGDDFVDITSLTPSERSTDAIISLLGAYNIDDDLAKYLYAGSVLQSSGDTLYSGLQVLGAVNESTTTLQIVQNNGLLPTTFWGDQSTGGYNGDAVAGILMRVLVKSRDAGADIDGKRIRVQARTWGDTYDFFNVTLGQGESVAAISTTPDAQNTTTQGTVTAYGDVTNTEGFQEIDLNNGNGLQPYYSQWTFGAQPDGLKALWEYTKDLTGRGTAKTLYGLDGELFLGITHTFPYGTVTGNAFVQNDVMTWGSGPTAGTGLLLGDDTTGTDMYIQLLTGVAPTNGIVVSNELSDGTVTLTSNPSTKTIPKIFGGSYTGTWIGAYGIGINPDDLTSSDTIQDLDGVTQTPPNNVVFTVSGIVSGEDRVLVGPRNGSILEVDQMSALSTVASGAGTFEVSSAIPSDTPAIGTIRVLGDGGVYHRIPYDSYTGSIFTLSGTTPDAVTSGANAYVSYIDADAGAASASFTTIYSSDRPLFIRVRDGKATPIKTFESQGTLSGTGGSSVASRITDE